MAKRLLLVDDSPTVRRVVQSALERQGFVVSSCSRAENAMKLANRERFDLFLIDYMMPGIGGIELLKLLQDQDIYIAPTVLMCTRTDPSIDEDLAKFGIVDTITKPFVPDAMVSVIEHALKRGFDDSRHLLSIGEEEGEDLTIPMRSPSLGEEHTSAEVQSTREFVRNEIENVIANSSKEELADLLTRRLLDNPDNGLVAAIRRRLLENMKKESHALYGDLNAVALPEVMQLLKYQGQTGLLEVVLNDSSYRIAFEDGRMMSVRALDPTAEQRLGRYFVQSDAMSEEALQRILRHRKGGSQPLGQRLLSEGLVNAEQLSAALRAQAEDLMYEMLRAQRGSFSLRRGIDLLPKAPGDGLSVDAVLFEALRRIDEWRVIEKEVSDYDAFYIAVDGAGDDRLSEDEKNLLEKIKEAPATPRHLIEWANETPFKLCKLLYRLVVLQHVYKRNDDLDEVPTKNNLDVTSIRSNSGEDIATTIQGPMD